MLISDKPYLLLNVDHIICIYKTHFFLYKNYYVLNINFILFFNYLKSKTKYFN